MTQISMKEMLDAGVHFGHQTARWNPKMKNYVYTVRGGIHIIDLQKTVNYAQTAAQFVEKMAAKGQSIIFVGTKKQAIGPIQDAAEKCSQYFITKRWLGGTLTNFATIKSSITRLKKIDKMREDGDLDLFSKKERSKIEKDYTRLSDYLGGIRDMNGAPGALFVVDLNKEHIAVAEAKKLGIPVIGIADTNSDPGTVEFPIPGNDDAIRSINLFANHIAEAYNEGAKNYQAKLRELGDKEVLSSTPKKAEVKTRGKRGADTSSGPAVVTVTKARKLVAAGTAEDVEIQEEVARELADRELKKLEAEANPTTEAPSETGEKTKTSIKDNVEEKK